MHEDPIQYELDLTERVESMFINDTHLFLGLCNLPPSLSSLLLWSRPKSLWQGKVAVFSIRDWKWVTDLQPPAEVGTGDNLPKVVGCDKIVVAIMWENIITVWNSGHRGLEAVGTKSGSQGPSESLQDHQKRHFGPKRALLGPLEGHEEVQYQAKVCGIQ